MLRASRGERLAPGAWIGHYAIVGELRVEATGVVYAGVHRVLPRRAAVKIVHSPALALREACILEALSHPSVPRIYECAADRSWIARERIDGRSLRSGASLAERVTVVRAVADILAHAHARGIVHHRLDEDVVVLTPGRATPVCVRGWGDAIATASSLAPGPMSDVYSLGALVHRALAGAAAEPPAPLTRLIDELLASDPAARPSAAEVCERVDLLVETPEFADLAVRIRG